MDLIALLATIDIALITAWIAWRQYQTSKAQVKASLFEKRYAVFEATWGELSEIGQFDPKKVLHPSNPSFTKLFPQASFLFGPDIEKYLKDISSKRIKLSVICAKTKDSESIMSADETNELMSWFDEQAKNGVQQVFAPYLDFKSWK